MNLHDDQLDPENLIHDFLISYTVISHYYSWYFLLLIFFSTYIFF